MESRLGVRRHRRTNAAYLAGTRPLVLVGEEDHKRMGTKGRQTYLLTWRGGIALVGLVISLTGFVWAVRTYLPLWLAIPPVLAMLGCAAYLSWNRAAKIARWVHPRLSTIGPWLLPLVLAFSIGTLVCVLPFRTPRHILFDAAKCGLFNSQDHQTQHTKFLHTDGVMWTIVDDGRTGGFSYHTDPGERASELTSSGGYITFYAEACDRLAFESLRFRCKASSAQGPVNVGIRLAVDDPKEAGDREKVTYVIRSLRAYGQIDGTWRTFELPLGAFEPNRYEPPFPRGLDSNTINKLVFYVDAEIATSCPQATLWFRDICFLP
jgi:hypothetical protein